MAVVAVFPSGRRGIIHGVRFLICPYITCVIVSMKVTEYISFLWCESDVTYGVFVRLKTHLLMHPVLSASSDKIKVSFAPRELTAADIHHHQLLVKSTGHSNG